MGGQTVKKRRLWIHAAFILVLVGLLAWAFWSPRPKSTYEGRLWPKAIVRNGRTLVYGYTEGLMGPYAITPRFDAAFDFEQGMALVCSEGLWGWIDSTGDFVIPPTFPMALPFDGDLAPVQDPGTGKYGLIGRDGDFVVPPKYGGIQVFGANNLGIGANTYRARMSAQGYTKLSYSFDRHREPAPIILVYLNGAWGALDRKGEMILKPQFDEIHSFQDEIACVLFHPSGLKPPGTRSVPAMQAQVATGGGGGMPGVKYGLLRNDGVLAPGRYDSIGRFIDGMAQVCRDGLWGYINTRGEEVIDLKFQRVRQLNGGGPCILARLDGKWGAIDRAGDWLVEPQFDGYALREDGYVQAETFVDGEGAGPFSSGEIGESERQARHVESSLITPDGRLLPGRFGGIERFAEGMAAVYCGPPRPARVLEDSRHGERFVSDAEAPDPEGGWGYIDEQGTVVIEPRFELAGPFKSGRAWARLDGRMVVIDTTGTVIEGLGPVAEPEKEENR